MDSITADHIRQCLVELGTQPQPVGGVAPRSPKPLSKKSIYNIHTGLSALWTWTVREGLADRHILHQILPGTT